MSKNIVPAIAFAAIMTAALGLLLPVIGVEPSYTVIAFVIALTYAIASS